MLTPIQQKWIDALRSGEWQQTREVLCHVDSDGSESYCCLGVLTELVMGTDASITKSVGEYTGGTFYTDAYDDYVSYPPEMVYHTTGLKRSAAYTLANYNDTHGYSFAQIAHAVEANPSKFFGQEA